MTQPAVSVVVVSRGRPDRLSLCLTALSQVDHPAFEVVVVACPRGMEVAVRWPVKAVSCDRRNISAARNLGIAAAAGEVVAFIDDDAVPEPGWLAWLAAPFADPEVAAAGGFVAGTNGISLQWAGGFVDRKLRETPLEAPGGATLILRSAPDRAVEVKGVNCAYRRAVLAEMGGFDPNLAYYLDETELNLRLAARGALTAVVPQARVHHAKAASDQRRADRTPLSLRDVGASTAVTLRRHGATAGDLAEGLAGLRSAQRARLAPFLRRGCLSRAGAEELLAGLAAGFAEGAARPLESLPAIGATPPAFRPFPAGPRPAITLAGRVWQSRRLKAEARAAAAGAVVRLFLFSPTALYHRVRFHPDGYWLQTGGLFGRSLRSDPLFRLWRFRDRCARERDLACGSYEKPDSPVSQNSTILGEMTQFAADFPLVRR